MKKENDRDKEDCEERRDVFFMLNMKDSEKHGQSNYVTRLHLQSPATKRHMKAIHGD